MPHGSADQLYPYVIAMTLFEVDAATHPSPNQSYIPIQLVQAH
ncbi:MAG: hypothetical protein P8N17_06890 [Luminiphilus sp.]|nr:hypothetical protein [Luminiphilus sp.]